MLSWSLSLFINLLILCLLAWLPQQMEFWSESALQVTLLRTTVSTSQPSPLHRQQIVSTRSFHVTVPTSEIRFDRAVPVAHARPVTTQADIPLRTAEESILVSAETQLPEHLPARPGTPIAENTTTPERDRGHTMIPSIGVPRRKSGWLQRLREKPGVVYAQVSGFGREIEGSYDIACVQHEDTADRMRTEALAHLVMAMNRWTNVRTRLLPDSLLLDDPCIQKLPLVYLAARGAFALSEKERVNLRRYLLQGGTLLFSDFSPDWGDRGATANSIRFELWKILGESGMLRPLSSNSPVSHSFFDFQKPPLMDRDRGGFYGIWLDGRIAVFYDAAGFGWQWRTSPEEKQSLQWGVNLLVYALGQRTSSFSP